MSELPNGVDRIIDVLAGNAHHSGGRLAHQEISKFKADLMNVSDRWHVIETAVFERACLNAGLHDRDAAELTDYLRRRKLGKRLVPGSSYRSFRFNLPVTVRPERKPVVSSPIW